MANPFLPGGNPFMSDAGDEMSDILGGGMKKIAGAFLSSQEKTREYERQKRMDDLERERVRIAGERAEQTERGLHRYEGRINPTEAKITTIKAKNLLNSEFKRFKVKPGDVLAPMFNDYNSLVEEGENERVIFNRLKEGDAHYKGMLKENAEKALAKAYEERDPEKIEALEALYGMADSDTPIASIIMPKVAQYAAEEEEMRQLKLEEMRLGVKKTKAEISKLEKGTPADTVANLKLKATQKWLDGNATEKEAQFIGMKDKPADQKKNLEATYLRLSLSAANAERGADEFVEMDDSKRMQVVKRLKGMADTVLQRYQEIGGDPRNIGTQPESQIETEAEESPPPVVDRKPAKNKKGVNSVLGKFGL